MNVACKVIAGAVVAVIACSLVLVSNLWPARSRARDCDEAWHTRRYLLRIEHVVSRYYEISDRSDLEAIDRVQNLSDLWLLINKKQDIAGPLIAMPPEQGFEADGWNSPYDFRVDAGLDKTKLTISSSNDKEKCLSLTIVFDKTKTDFHSYCGWTK